MCYKTNQLWQSVNKCELQSWSVDVQKNVTQSTKSPLPHQYCYLQAPFLWFPCFESNLWSWALEFVVLFGFEECLNVWKSMKQARKFLLMSMEQSQVVQSFNGTKWLFQWWLLQTQTCGLLFNFILFCAAEWGISVQYQTIFWFHTPVSAVQVLTCPPQPIWEHLVLWAAPQCHPQDEALAGTNDCLPSCSQKGSIVAKHWLPLEPQLQAWQSFLNYWMPPHHLMEEFQCVASS